MRSYTNTYSLLKILPILALLAITAPKLAQSSPFSGLGQTHSSTLNDLIRRIPSNSRIGERRLAELSAIQEQITIHERRMRGDGLPSEIAEKACQGYLEIQDAIISDRITTEYGAELLSLHARLLDVAYDWDSGKYQDEPKLEGALKDAFATVLSELRENAASHTEVPYDVRTPIVNGFQVWLIGLENWGGECRSLTKSERFRIRNRAAKLERFERYYKSNGSLSRHERKLLHEQLIELQREVIEILT